MAAVIRNAVCFRRAQFLAISRTVSERSQVKM